MEQQFTTPAFTEMMTQISTFQKENMTQIMDTMNRSFLEKNPMKLFCVEKPSHAPMAGYFPDVFDITEKISREMLERAMGIMPALFKNDKDSLALLKKTMTETPTGFLEKMKLLVPDKATESQKEKINNIIEKQAAYHTAAMEFLYSIFIPIWDETQMNPGQKTSETAGNVEKPMKKKTE